MHDAAARRCAWLVLFLVATPAAAAPSLRVRAGTSLDARAERDGDVLRLRGTLTDDQGAGLGARELVLRLEREGSTASIRTLVTAADGSFEAALPSDLPFLDVRAIYEGDAYYERGTWAERVDTALAAVQLTLRLARGTYIDLEHATTPVEARASSLAGAAGLRVTIADELGRELANGETDADGRFISDLPSSNLTPGPGVLTATTQPDATRAAGHARLPVAKSLSTKLDLTATANPDRRAIMVQGRVSTSRGPLQGKAIALLIDGAHALTVVSDHGGAFSATLGERMAAAAQARGDDTRVQARFDPDSPSLRPSQSSTLTVRFETAAAPSRAWLIAATLLSLVLSLWLMRRGGSAVEPATTRKSLPGMRLGTAARRAAPSLCAIGGRIEDVDTGLPLPAAVLHVRSLIGAEIVVPVNTDGTFASGELPSGRHTLTARAAGYAEVRAHVDIPHAGQGSSILVALSGLRSVALSTHRDAIQRIAPAAKLSPSWTVRDAHAHVQPTGSAPSELEDFTTLVEDTAYAARVPTTEDIDLLQAHARQVETAAGSQTSPTPRRRR